MKSFLRFSGSSAICFLLDYGLFTLLNSVLLVSLPDGTRELCATYGARIVSAVTNFFLNRLLVFQDKSAAGQSIWRYAVLAVVQASLSAAGSHKCNKPARNGHQDPGGRRALPGKLPDPEALGLPAAYRHAG